MFSFRGTQEFEYLPSTRVLEYSFEHLRSVLKARGKHRQSQEASPSFCNPKNYTRGYLKVGKYSISIFTKLNLFFLVKSFFFLQYQIYIISRKCESFSNLPLICQYLKLKFKIKSFNK